MHTGYFPRGVPGCVCPGRRVLGLPGSPLVLSARSAWVPNLSSLAMLKKIQISIRICHMFQHIYTPEDLKVNIVQNTMSDVRLTTTDTYRETKKT